MVLPSGEPPTKKQALSTMKIGTHSGTFHCDEVLACFMLKLLPEYKDAEIVRTRDQKLLDTCDIVVDVGGVYDPSKHLYDHHQQTFTGTMKSLKAGKPWTIKLSSAGLVYLHFGERALSELMGASPQDKLVQVIYDKVYEKFIQEVDAIDNGVPQYEGEPRYGISTNLSSRVGHLNPPWNDNKMNEEEQFVKALSLVGGEFKERVMFYSQVWWPGRQLVVTAINNRHQVDPSGEIVAFDDGFCPWKEHLFMIEKELQLKPNIKFAIFPDTKGDWRVQGVPVAPDSFVLRVPLLAEWGGLRDDALSKVNGLPGSIFVHTTGFIGGHKEREGALQMARITLQKRVSSTGDT
jgi:uncharacterized UPF0160 family protein